MRSVSLSLIVALLSLPACDSGDEATPGSDESASAPTAQANESAKADGGATGTASAENPPASSQVGAAVDAFRNWAPVHTFLSAAVWRGVPVSASEAVVISTDNHVGVTQNGGESWSFARHTHAAVRAVAGYTGGPYVAVGTSGYMAISEDGAIWRDLPRYTSDTLIAVVASDLGIIAVGKNGAFVRYDRTGSSGAGGMLPDKLKPSHLGIAGATIVASAGKKSYGTNDGASWAPVATSLPSTKLALTSTGVCSLGKVAKKQKGVVCSVKGLAHGLGEAEAIVENRGTVAVTRDAGRTWTTSTLPYKGANSIFGTGGTYYALGNRGAVAISRDGGKTWADQAWDESNGLRAGLVDGTNVFIVGDRGTIIYSRDGGTNWDYAVSPVSASFKTIIEDGGKYLASDGRRTAWSSDGVTWQEELELVVEPPARPDSCSRLPVAGARCKYASFVTTPQGLPNVRGFAFAGDNGVAVGDAGLVAFTRDGGSTWSTTRGGVLARVSLFDVEGSRVVASDGRRIAVSTDAGETFKAVALPGKGKLQLFALHISEQGSAYAAGKGGVLLRSSADLSTWGPVATAPKNKTVYTSIFEVGSALFAAGAKGELWRSEDGLVWSYVNSTIRRRIQAMTGEGDTVLAVTAPGRKVGNYLMRSDDGGQHFYLAHEVSHAGTVRDFELEAGTLRYGDRISDDLGATWRKADGHYWPGGVALADGSGLKISAHSYYYNKDRLYLVGDEEDDWVLLDSVFSENARLSCDEASGCWMLAGGTAYRPLGRFGTGSGASVSVAGEP